MRNLFIPLIVLLLGVASVASGQSLTETLMKIETIEKQANKVEQLEELLVKLEKQYRADYDALQAQLLESSGLSAEVNSLADSVDQIKQQVFELALELAEAKRSQSLSSAGAPEADQPEHLAAAMAPGPEEETESKFSVGTGVDFVSRYVWRGLEFGGSPSIQPCLSLSYSGWELGFWGAYATANNATDADEADIWISHTWGFASGMSVTAIVTDYYFPNAGAKLGNYNDYDALILATNDDGTVDTTADPGAHTLEAGVCVAGSETFPLSFSAFWNFFNDAGHNAYFQLDYGMAVGDVDIGLFVGATPGSDENPDYYGSDNLQIINLGVSASKEIPITGDFSLPVSVSYAINPSIEKSYIVFGLSL